MRCFTESRCIMERRFTKCGRHSVGLYVVRRLLHLDGFALSGYGRDGDRVHVR